MTALSEAERDCAQRYVDLVREQLGDEVEEVWLFGSAARGEMWADFWPMRSDIDLLVVTRMALTEEREQELFDLTYHLYLECGRQISPAFRTREQLRGKWARLHDEVRRDGRRLWPEYAATVEP